VVSKSKKQTSSTELPSSSLQPERYEGRPLILILDNYILDCIEELAPNKQALIVSLPLLIFSASLFAENIMHYQVVHGMPQLPENSILDEVSAVAVDSESTFTCYNAAGESGLIMTSLIKARLKFLPFLFLMAELETSKKNSPKNYFVWPHGLTIDNNDNLWITDVALHQVFKFAHDGKLLLTLGRCSWG
jgi:NHL repeat